MVHPNYPEQAGYLPEVAETGGGGGPRRRPARPILAACSPIQPRLHELVARGERVIAQCSSCHTFEAGGANGTGPNLHDVFGRPVAAAHAGFHYSDAMQRPWRRLGLSCAQRFPALAGAIVRGTKMAFAGMRNDRGPRGGDRLSALDFAEQRAAAGAAAGSRAQRRRSRAAKPPKRRLAHDKTAARRETPFRLE